LPFEIRNALGERIDHAFHDGRGASLQGTPRPTGQGDSSRPDGDGRLGEASLPNSVVVIGHGVTSHWDRPWQTELSAALGDAGIASVLVSFAGNGASEGRFEDVTPTKEADDLGSVLDALRAWGVRRFAYAGHSMGGAVGVLRASVDSRVEALVSLAGMFHVHAFMQRTFGHLVPGEGLMLDKPGCIWNRTLEADAARLGSLDAQAAAVVVPWLLVHGDADELVPLQDSLDAQAAAGGRPELVVLPGVDHRFAEAVPSMSAAVVPWLVRHLRRVQG
jgi:pimeloyl-ACP methyl ester carboxylesterase